MQEQSPFLSRGRRGHEDEGGELLATLSSREDTGEGKVPAHPGRRRTGLSHPNPCALLYPQNSTPGGCVQG